MSNIHPKEAQLLELLRVLEDDTVQLHVKYGLPARIDVTTTVDLEQLPVVPLDELE